MIREAILFWVGRGTCPTRSPWFRKMIVFPFSFGADARTLAVIDRFKDARDGNVSATVCDLIAGAGAARPQWVAQTGGKRTPPRFPDEPED